MKHHKLRPSQFNTFFFEVTKVSHLEIFTGKIRVFCRIRPVSRTEVMQGGAIVVEKIDDFSVTVETPRGQREFQFDKVFNAEASQEDLFHDTNRLDYAS